jgi:hypothetical protein
VNVWTYAWVPTTPAEAGEACALADKVGASQVLFWEADYIDDRTNAQAIKAALRQRAVPAKLQPSK